MKKSKLVAYRKKYYRMRKKHFIIIIRKYFNLEKVCFLIKKLFLFPHVWEEYKKFLIFQIASSLLKYKKFFKPEARKFHFSKYKKFFPEWVLLTFRAWKSCKVQFLEIQENALVPIFWQCSEYEYILGTIYTRFLNMLVALNILGFWIYLSWNIGKLRFLKYKKVPFLEV